MFGDQANVIRQFKPNNNASYGNIYNSNWRNHPNFSWKPRAPQYTQPGQASQQASDFEQAIVNVSKVVGDFIGDQKSINAQLSQRIDSVGNTLSKMMDGMQNDLSQKIDNLQYSISRLTNLNTVQEKGRFPSQPHKNPKGIHEVEAHEGESSQVRDVKALITLRSGKKVELPTPKPHAEKEKEEEKTEKREEIKGKKKDSSERKEDHDSTVNANPEKVVIKGDMMKKHTPPPFPQALHWKKGIRNASEILEVLRQVKVNIPLLDMIKQVPTYAKFLKDLCTIKRGLNVNKKAFLIEQVSAIIQCKSLLKYKDSGCLTISVMIGETVVEKALLDLGAIVNLLPLLCLQAIGTWNGLMQLTFGNMTLDLNIFYMSKKPITPEEEEGPEEVCSIDTLVEEHCNHKMQEKLNENLEDLEEGEAQEAANEETPKLNLKPLPTKLKYTYLEENKKCPVVISSSLTTSQEVCLLEVLKRCKKAIGWKISYLKGISPLVVRADVLKLLQAGIIYPISDSLWVSPTQVVPKKSGITVVQNEKGEEVVYMPHFRLEGVY
ncbi:hypothetical protein CK203_062297 [Vitis vinifera]|uniref:Retrotransposon gag protein n=1 Tax=Vitis vinifera TaxID=29760 RepID=A0A438GD35_VITVI|nr:hypothetical protein CK203_062297 [Vitis vinifera]